MTDYIRTHSAFSNLTETTYGGMDPDYEVGAIEREHDARYSLLQRELAAAPKWEELIGKLGGTVIFHRKPDPKRPALYSSEKPSISAKIPGGFKLTTSDYGVYLVAPEQFGKDVRKKLAEIFKSHGCDLYSSDFACFGNVDSYYGSNAVNVGYYSEISDGKDMAGAIVAAVDYFGSIFGKTKVSESKSVKVKEPGWYVVDHMDRPVDGPYSEGNAKKEADEMSKEYSAEHGEGEIPAFDALYFSDYDVNRLRESELTDMINQDDAQSGDECEGDMTNQFEGKSFKRNDDDEDNLKKKQRDDERRQAPSKRDQDIDEGKTYRRSDDDADDKRAKDQERKDGAKNKRSMEVTEGRPPKPHDPEDNPTMHDLKSKIMDLKGRLDKTSPFDSRYSELRNKIDDLAAKLDKVKPYGKSKTEVTEQKADDEIDASIEESLARLAKLSGLQK